MREFVIELSECASVSELCAPRVIAGRTDTETPARVATTTTTTTTPTATASTAANPASAEASSAKPANSANAMPVADQVESGVAANAAPAPGKGSAPEDGKAHAKPSTDSAQPSTDSPQPSTDSPPSEDKDDPVRVLQSTHAENGCELRMFVSYEWS